MATGSWENPDFKNDTGMSFWTDKAGEYKWSVHDIPFGELPPVPEKSGGTPENRAKRLDIWRGVISMQLQADMRAVGMSTHLFNESRHLDAKQYYATMVTDESTHTEAWLRLAEETGTDLDINPHLERLADMVESSDLETADFTMQGVFEGGLGPRFKNIAESAPGTVLADICTRLRIDDMIHHRSGLTYLETLLPELSPERKYKIAMGAARALPDFVRFATWHPKAMASVAERRKDADMAWVQEQAERGARLGVTLGLPFHKIDFDTLGLPEGMKIRVAPPTELAA